MLRVGLGLHITDRSGLPGAASPVSPLLARHWRFRIIGSGRDDVAALSRFVLTFRNGSSYTLSASATGAGAVANLEDGSPSTFWKTPSAYTTVHLLADLGAGVSDTLTRISAAQTDEVGAELTHPAAFRVQYATTASPVEDDWVDYCVRLTQTPTATTSLVAYPINADIQSGIDYYLTPQPRWGFIVRGANTNGTLAEVKWRDSLGAGLGTVSSHITRSATLNPALLYDVNDATETSFETRAQPQLLATQFTSAFQPFDVELTGAATASATWNDLAIIAGPTDGNMQIITEVLPTFTTPNQKVVVLPREPAIVQQHAIIHHKPGQWTAAQWTDAIAFGGEARHLVQATASLQPSPASSPARLIFTNTSGEDYMTAAYTAVNARTVIAVFRRPSVNWEGVTDGAGAPVGLQHKISGGAGGVKTLGVYAGTLTGARSDAYINGVGWGVDPTTTDLPQATWVATMQTAAAAVAQTNHKAARFGTGGATVSFGMILFLGDRDVSKNGPWKQLERYVERIIQAVEAA